MQRTVGGLESGTRGVGCGLCTEGRGRGMEEEAWWEEGIWTGGAASKGT